MDDSQSKSDKRLLEKRACADVSGYVCAVKEAKKNCGVPNEKKGSHTAVRVQGGTFFKFLNEGVDK